MIEKILYKQCVCDFCGIKFLTSRFFPLKINIISFQLKSKIKFNNICSNCFENVKEQFLKAHLDSLPVKNSFCSLDEIKFLENKYRCPGCIYSQLIVKNTDDYITLYCNICDIEYHCRIDEKGRIIKCLKISPKDQLKN